MQQQKRTFVQRTHDPKECGAEDCEEEFYSDVGYDYHWLREHSRGLSDDR